MTKRKPGLLDIIGFPVLGLGPLRVLYNNKRDKVESVPPRVDTYSRHHKEYFFGSLAEEFKAFASASYNNFLRLSGDIKGSLSAISSVRDESLGSLAYAGFFAEGKGRLGVDARGSTRAGIRSDN
ncbi:MAG: hypothetical protein QW579_04280, partial [Desulfurococcaceae archaeon]